MQLTSAKDGLTYANILTSGVYHSVIQYRDLWIEPKLKNAMLSTCVVALAQQLCGSKSIIILIPPRRHVCSEANYDGTVNVFAFYSSESSLNVAEGGKEKIVSRK